MERANFSELGISKELLKAVTELGFEGTTQIQATAIPEMLSGRDIIGQAQTGTGKTAAFAIPVLEKIDVSLKKIQSLIVCPTRELACQVADQFILLGKHIKGLKVIPVYGGQPIDRQLRSLGSGAHIVVGTPGRLLDHMQRGTINFDSVRTAILDEADKMLDMGFIEDVSYIIKALPENRQTALFSATMPEPVLELTKYYMKEPVYLKVTPDVLSAPNIVQEYFVIKKGAKLDAITRVLDASDFDSVMMFCNTKAKVDRIVEQLRLRGYSAEGIHGDKSQSRRERAIDMFKRQRIDILVATDVAARGIDIDDIDAVINYHPPQDDEYYVHRIGRTGRAGKKGIAYTFIYGDEEHRITELEKFSGSKIKLSRVPSFEEKAAEHNEKIISMIKKEIESGDMSKFSDEIEKMRSENYDLLQIASALMKMISKKDSREDDLNHDVNAEIARITEMVPVFVNLGKTDKLQQRDILGAFTSRGVPADMIGRIEINDTHTYVNVHGSVVDSLISGMDQGSIKGLKAKVQKVQ